MRNPWPKMMVLLLLLNASILLTGGGTFASTVPLTVDCSVKLGPIPHFWSECVGTGTMEYCLKPAWRSAARIGAKEAGFKRVRGHGILIHINNVDNILLGSAPNWNFSVIDQIYDTIIACGLRPVVELSFMPKSLQSNGPTSPPRDFSAWKQFIASLASHLQTRYGVEEVRRWYWEVWNEYDYQGFWTSDAATYYKLYDSAAAGVRSVDTNIIIGGPAATNSGVLQNFWNNCDKKGIRFLSNHSYGVGTENTALPTNIRNDNRIRSNVIKGTGKKLFSLNTEYNSSYSGAGGNPVPNCYSMDNHRNAPFVAKTIKLIIDDCIDGTYQYPDMLSYWAISDCFDEWWGNNNGSYIEGNNYVPFGQVFGLITYHGIRKAAFNAHVMLHKMGTVGLKMTGGSGDNDGIDGFATVNSDSSEVAVMVYSYYNDLTTTGPDRTVNLTINNLPFANGQNLTITHYRVDSLRSNPYGVWKRLGSPTSPTSVQWDSMRAHQNLEMMEPQSTLQYTGAPISKTITLGRWAVSLFIIKGGATETLHKAAWRTGSDPVVLRGRRLTLPPGHAEMTGVCIYGANGRLVKKVNVAQGFIDLGADFARGTYMVAGEGAGSAFIKRVALH